ncbi:sulfotransferase family protein [Sagittula sp. NFXS13]|uniref:sulfotransferase n=1 Tax=Sagittula sp. NFXS13 TaxID=2819095 RepID=UPI0032DFDF81
MTQTGRLKIVNLGLPKTGTTTFARALQEAGLFVADHRVRGEHTDDTRIRRDFVGAGIYTSWYATGNPLELLDFYDALTEISGLKPPLALFPQCDYALLKAMRDKNPDVKFVTTTRPPEAICASMDNFRNMGKRVAQANIPGLPHGFGKDWTERVTWIETMLDMHRDVFAGRDNYLQLDVGAPDAAEKLSAFIGLPLPWWGRENVTQPPAETR